MKREEIFWYVHMGSSIDRRELEQYPGIIQDVVVREDAELQINFLDQKDIERNEGEISLYFQYENYDTLFQAVEEYLGSKMEEWRSFTRKNWWYPPVQEDADLDESWSKLKVDFVNKNLSLPTGYMKYHVNSEYWEALESGEVKIDDPIEVYFAWSRNKWKQKEERWKLEEEQLRENE